MATLQDKLSDRATFLWLLLELHSYFAACEADELAVLQVLCNKVLSLGECRSACCIDLTWPDGTPGIAAMAGDRAAPESLARAREAIVRCAQTRRPLALAQEASGETGPHRERALLLPLIVGPACDYVLLVHAMREDGFSQDVPEFLFLAAQQCGLALALRQERRAKWDALDRLALQTAILDNASEGIFVTDHEGTILTANPAVSRVTGYSMEELIGNRPRILSSGKHDAAFYAGMWASIRSTGAWKGEILNKRKSGEIYPEWLSISAIRDTRDEVLHYIAIFTDISYQKEIEGKLRQLALHDPLTGLANRLLFQDHFELALSRARLDGRTVAVLYLDLDDFKQVNDLLGHAEGDTLLQQVGVRVATCVRKGDTVARLGGDEFAVLLDHIEDKRDAAIVASNIINAMSAPFEIAGQQWFITTCIGIGVYPEDADTVQLLMRHADHAMYRAKAQGGNACRFHFAEPNPSRPDAPPRTRSARQTADGRTRRAHAAPGDEE